MTFAGNVALIWTSLAVGTYLLMLSIILAGTFSVAVVFLEKPNFALFRKMLNPIAILIRIYLFGTLISALVLATALQILPIGDPSLWRHFIG